MGSLKDVYTLIPGKMKYWGIVFLVLFISAIPLHAQDAEEGNDNEQEVQEEVQQQPEPFINRLMFWRRDANRERVRNPYENYNQRELDEALWYAIANRDHSTMRDLLREGASANSRNMQQRTALIEASRVGFENGVKILIDYGASVNAKDMYGGTAYIYASRGGHSDIVYLLIRNGARPDSQ